MPGARSAERAPVAVAPAGPSRMSTPCTTQPARPSPSSLPTLVRADRSESDHDRPGPSTRPAPATHWADATGAAAAVGAVGAEEPRSRGSRRSYDVGAAGPALSVCPAPEMAAARRLATRLISTTRHSYRATATSAWRPVASAHVDGAASRELQVFPESCQYAIESDYYITGQEQFRDSLFFSCQALRAIRQAPMRSCH